MLSQYILCGASPRLVCFSCFGCISFSKYLLFLFFVFLRPLASLPLFYLICRALVVRLRPGSLRFSHSWLPLVLWSLCSPFFPYCSRFAHYLTHRLTRYSMTYRSLQCASTQASILEVGPYYNLLPSSAIAYFSCLVSLRLLSLLLPLCSRRP